MKAYKLTHNNMTIQISEPTVKMIRATLNDFIFQVFMPDERIREEMIDTFSKKLANKDYEVVDVEDKE